MSASPASPLGQVLILGVHDNRWSSKLERTLRAVQPGGVLLYPRALRSPGECAELLHKIAGALAEPPLLAITEEGGSVNPLKAFLPPLSAPRILSRRGPTAVKRAGELIGAALKLLGFNLNLAPRLDLANPEINPLLDTPTFGGDPKRVAECGRAFIAGLSLHGILACGKHFPGRGVPEYDEKGLPTIGKAMAKLWREDLLPFRELLTRLPFIQLSNCAYKAYDFDSPQPAAMSPKVVHDLLGVKLEFRGAAVADLRELLTESPSQLKGEQAASMSRRAFILSIKAGCDLQLVGSSVKMADVILPAIQKKIEDGSLAQERVEEALQRIRAAKKGLRRPSGKLSAQSFDRLSGEFEKFNQSVRAGGEIET